MIKVYYLFKTKLNLERQLGNKGAKKKTRFRRAGRSTKRVPSYFEHMDFMHPDTPQSQSSSQKSAKKKISLIHGYTCTCSTET
jgi:hypothetical protein